MAVRWLAINCIVDPSLAAARPASHCESICQGYISFLNKPEISLALEGPDIIAAALTFHR